VNPPVVDDSTSGVGFKRGLTYLGEPSNFSKETDIPSCLARQQWSGRAMVSWQGSGRRATGFLLTDASRRRAVCANP
jgi:hypothetical protein